MANRSGRDRGRLADRPRAAAGTPGPEHHGADLAPGNLQMWRTRSITAATARRGRRRWNRSTATSRNLRTTSKRLASGAGASSCRNFAEFVPQVLERVVDNADSKWRRGAPVPRTEGVSSGLVISPAGTLTARRHGQKVVDRAGQHLEPDALTLVGGRASAAGGDQQGGPWSRAQSTSAGP